MHSLTSEYLAARRLDGIQAATLCTLGECQGKQQHLRCTVIRSPEGPAPDRAGEVLCVVRPTGRRGRCTCPVAVPGHPQRNAKASFRTGDRRPPRCPGADPLVRCALALQRERSAATAHPAVSLHAAGWRAPEASSLGCHQGQHGGKPWLHYFWGALLRACSKFEERVGTIEHGRGSKGDRVRAEVLERNLPVFDLRDRRSLPGREPRHGAIAAMDDEIRTVDRIDRQGARSETEVHYDKHLRQYSGSGDWPQDGSVRTLHG